MDRSNLKPSWQHQLQRGTLTNGKALHYSYVDLAKATDTLTFDQRFLNPAFTPMWPDTPFKEIKYASLLDILPESKHYLLVDQPRYVGSMQQYARQLLNSVKRFFLAIWNDKTKIVMHSGGYDSRIISLALMELRQQEGDAWLGDIHFRCHQPEEDLFKIIMQAEGWRPDQYSCYDGPQLDYYDIGNPRAVFNGWHNYNQAMNFWRDIIPPGSENEHICITGFGGEMFKFLAMYNDKGARQKYCDNNHLNILLDYNPGQGQWEGAWNNMWADLWQPFWSYEYLSYSLSCPPEWCTWDVDHDNIRKEIIKASGLVELADLPHGKHDYTWNISTERYAYMMHAWQHSLFYRHHAHTAPDINPIKNMYKWDARMWAFHTVYDEIFKNRKPC